MPTKMKAASGKSLSNALFICDGGRGSRAASARHSAARARASVRPRLPRRGASKSPIALQWLRKPRSPARGISYAVRWLSLSRWVPPWHFAAKAATSTIPIVFGGGIDPVKAGLVASLHRPGGNVTGVTSMNAEIETKRLGLLNELLPRATRFAVLVNPNSPLAEFDIKDAQASAKTIGRQIEILTASTNREIDAAFASLVQKGAEALLIGPDVFFTNRRVQLATLAVRHGVPAIYSFREFAEAGGLMSYGTSNADRDRQVGVYAGRILKGEKPVDLPILRPTKFELVINLQTARTLGLTVPNTLLARADEVIE